MKNISQGWCSIFEKLHELRNDLPFLSEEMKI